MLITKQNYQSQHSNYLNFRNYAPKQASISNLTFSRINSTRNLYEKIRTQLHKFTESGIKKLEEKFPVSIGKALIFHNCGDYNTSIAVIISNSRENKGMMRIIERKGNSKHWGDSIVINSFVLDGKNMLLKNEKENDVNSFPSKRISLKDYEITQENLDKRLESVLIDLQDKMLALIEKLNLKDIQDLKPDIALLPDDLIKIIKQIPKENQGVNDLLASIPKKLGRETRDSYPHYKFRPTTNIHTFQNLGDENLTIAYAPYVSFFEENLSRLYVWDKYGEVKDSFTIKDDSKMVINSNRKDIRKIPRNLKYANTEEILQEENLPSFEKYLRLYTERLFGLKSHMLEHIKKKKEKNYYAELPSHIQTCLINIIESINAISERLKHLPDKRVANVKQTFSDLYSPPGRKGFTFCDPQSGKKVYILPLVYRNDPNIFRLTVTEADGSERLYLVKDCKYIVKNYNPETPKKLPETLLFMNQAELEKINIAKDLEFFQGKIYEYEEHVSNKFNEYLELKSTHNAKHQ
jgi:hypothetical protein